ncbi:hypothetical protein HXX76_000686 [Chlamydomonas incerta]|uniref:Chitin-binding type-2 domain-containing protein n=1 Tax=Chlamydomonas incerta TaxID=51695 RepID=A0A835WF46_CHLIN|nr:hypothetical protein HXX76_000686 [Chlamydomonas incerta]|eukprot:KAG2446086.1 hypothetical protein HXX76_000686 [Chlamydomonas incerta]
MRSQTALALLIAGVLALLAGGRLPGAAAAESSSSDTPARRVFTDDHLVLPGAVAAAAAATAGGLKQQQQHLAETQRRRPDEGSLTHALAGHARHHGRALQQSSDSATATTATSSSTPSDSCSINNLPDGSYSEPSDCTKFVLCYSGLTYVFDCANCRASDRAAAGPDAAGSCQGQSKLWFNSDTGSCDWPSAVPTCSAADSTTGTTDAAGPVLPTAPPPSPPPVSATTPVSDTTFRNANEGSYGGYGRSGYGGYGGDGGYGGGIFRDSNGSGGGGSGSGGSSSPSEDDLLIELRAGKPYSPVPGYGSGEDGGWWPGSSPDPADLASDLAGGPDDDLLSPGGNSSGSDIGSSSNSGSGSGSGRASGGDPCAVPAASTSQPQPQPGAAVAEYSAVFEAPECDGRGKNTCMTSGLAGKGSDGAEMDAPNTLYSECADGDAAGGGGGGAGFVADVALQAASGSVLRSGETARIVAQVVCDPDVPASYVDFFYTGYTAMGGAGRVWTYVSTQSCTELLDASNSSTPTSAGANATAAALLATSLPFFVPDGTAALGGSVAVRVQLRETAGGAVNDLPVAFPCAYGSYGSNDRDDLVVQVCPALPGSRPPASSPPPPPPPPTTTGTGSGVGSGTRTSSSTGDVNLRGSDGSSVGGSGAGPGWSEAAAGGGAGAGTSGAATDAVAASGGQQKTVEAARAVFYAIFSAKVPPTTGPA